MILLCSDAPESFAQDIVSNEQKEFGLSKINPNTLNFLLDRFVPNGDPISTETLLGVTTENGKNSTLRKLIEYF